MLPDISALLAALGLHTDTYQMARGSAFQDRWFPGTDVALPLVVHHVDAGALSWLQKCLPRAYPPHHRLHWIDSAHVDQAPQTLTIAELETWQEIQPTALLIVPPLATDRSLNALANIVARLRAPGGCPWDQEQTLESLRSEMLSEAYEVCDAIDHADYENLQEELGDLLMDVLFLITIATDDGLFQLADVVAEICQKMIRRHPHVYGDGNAADSATVLDQWEAIKRAEYATKGKTKRLLDGIPVSLPALEMARQLQIQASRAGYDTVVHSDEDVSPTNTQRAQARLGHELWTLVAQAHQEGLNPEETLRRYSSLFRTQIEAATTRTSTPANNPLPPRPEP